MASGLPHRQWNGGDDSPALVHIATVTAWFAERRLPWGLRVPTGLPWTGGALRVQRRMGGAGGLPRRSL